MSDIDKLNSDLSKMMDAFDKTLREENMEWYERQCESKRKYGFPVEPYNDKKNYVPYGATKYFGMPTKTSRNR